MRWVSLLIVLLLPLTASAQLNTLQGGTGLKGVSAGSIPFGSVTNLRMATSSGLQWNNSTSNLTATYASTTAFTTGSLYATTLRDSLNRPVLGIEFKKLYYEDGTDAFDWSSPGTFVMTGTTINLADFDCSTYFNGGKLSTNNSRNIICANDNGVGTSTDPFMAAYFVATSTDKASTFPFASTTALTISGTGFFPDTSIWNSTTLGVGTRDPDTSTSLHVVHTGTAMTAYVSTVVAGFQSTSAATTDAEVAITSGDTGLACLNLGDNVSANYNNSRICNDGSSNDLDFYTADTLNMSILSDGKVGIGTTSPSQLFSVHGNSYISGTSFFGGAITATSTLTSTAPDAAILIGAQTLTGDGVSIRTGGTSIPSGQWDAYFQAAYPTAFVATTTSTTGDKLVLKSQRAGIVANSLIGGIAFWSDDTDLTAGGKISAGIQAIASQTHSTTGQGTSLTFNVTRSASTTPFEAMRVFHNGNVGIGDTTPTARLSIATSTATAAVHASTDTLLTPNDSELIQVANLDDAGTYVAINLRTRTTSASAWNIENIWMASSQGDLAFRTRTGSAASAERVRFANNGNVGIGTSTPFQKLSLTGGSLFQASGDQSGAMALTPIGGVDTGVAVGTAAVSQRPIYVYNNYAYVVTQAVAGACSSSDQTGCEIRIYDVSTSTPAFINGIETGAAVHSAFANGRYLYVTKANSGITEDFIIYDVSNPYNIATTSATNLALSANAVEVVGKYAYITTDSSSVGEFRIYDVSDPRTPLLTGVIDFGTISARGGIAISGNYAYVTSTTVSAQELRVIDISNPAAPVQVSSMTFNGAGTSIAASGKYVYAGKTTAGIAEELIIYDASNPLALATTTAVDIGASVESLFIAGRYLYVGINTTTNEFRVYDVSEPYSIFQVSTDDIGNANVSGVFVKGNRAYLGKTNAGDTNDFIVYDITGTETQSLLAHSFEAGQAQIRNNLIVGGQLYGYSANFGAGGISTRGPLSVFTSSTTATIPVSANFMGGNVGIGTTTPYAALSVFGQTVSSYFTATSTTLYSTFASRVGIATTTPAFSLDVFGSARIDSSGELIIPNKPDPTVSNQGAIAIDTSSASTSLRLNVGGTEQALYFEEERYFRIASTSLSNDGRTFSGNSTSTWTFFYPSRKTKVNFFSCKSKSSLLFRIGDGAASTTHVNAVPAWAEVASSTLTNNTFNKNEVIQFEVGTSSTADTLDCRINYTTQAE